MLRNIALAAAISIVSIFAALTASANDHKMKCFLSEQAAIDSKKDISKTAEGHTYVEVENEAECTKLGGKLEASH